MNKSIELGFIKKVRFTNLTSLGTSILMNRAFKKKIRLTLITY